MQRTRARPIPMLVNGVAQVTVRFGTRLDQVIAMDRRRHDYALLYWTG